MHDFDTGMVPSLRGKPNLFGNSFVLDYDSMLLTVVRVVKNENFNDVLCQIDLGASGSSFFTKHLLGIPYEKDAERLVIGTVGVGRKLQIYGFTAILELYCPIMKVIYSYPIVVEKMENTNKINLFVTLQDDANAHISKLDVRFIFANLGRDILAKNKIDPIIRFSKGTVVLERELTTSEIENASYENYPSSTQICIKQLT